MSLIQGPPGTGKTYLAVKTLSTLLDNQQLWQGPAENSGMLSKFGGFDERANWKANNWDFWKHQGMHWRDERIPILVICQTVN